MKVIKIIIIAIVFIVGMSCGTSQNLDLQYDEIDPAYYNTQFPASYIIYDYKDANKRFDGTDDNLCWLYVASNLDANYNNTNEEEIANYLKDNFSNRAGWVSDALNLLGYADLIVIEQDINYIVLFIKFCINNNRAVALRLYEQDILYGHLITIFGYEQQEDDSIYLYFTESSDKEKKLRKVNFINNKFANVEHSMFNINYGLALINDLLN